MNLIKMSIGIILLSLIYFSILELGTQNFGHYAGQTTVTLFLYILSSTIGGYFFAIGLLEKKQGTIQ